MDEFKTFYNDKKGKYILFFGFYLIFFIFLAIYIRSVKDNKPIEKNKEEIVEKEITTYDISNLINNDYSYEIEVSDNYNTTNFSGTKNNVDYANFENKYFLDIYNINQLLKRSKFMGSEDNILTYYLYNKELNELLLTNKTENEEISSNKIFVYVNDDAEVEKIVFDLSTYFEKVMYQITINYSVGDNNENSPS